MPPTNPPPAQDNSRNEYIPSFISQKPFYVTDDIQGDADYLEHQRLHAAPKDTLDKAKWYDRGKKLGPAATKFRKGACENCGAMTHKTKECLSRPRKTGAKYTGRDIQADEAVDSVKLGWDAKRDRWNGYDPKEYDAVVKEYEDLEAIKKATSDRKAPEDGDTADSDVRYGEETDMGRSQPTSTRQLRLREDTAGYLKNLDLDSARYDPKTRSMDTETKQDTGGDLADQGFMRPSESEAFERAQKYAWESQESNLPNASKLHLQANPTEGAILIKRMEAEAAAKKDAQRQYLLSKYGTAEGAPSTTGTSTQETKAITQPATTAKRKAITATSAYTEYTSTGLPINSSTKTAPVAKSKYPEDVHPNNHTSIFGSWWTNFTWGYACCHSTVRNSYCTGEEGKVAFAEAEGRRKGIDLLQIENGKEEEAESADADARVNMLADAPSDTVVDGLEKQRKEQDPNDTTKTKKRTIHELQSGISEEEMEAYKRSKLSAQDPMAAMLGRDELVEG
jgi:pre-mRNA-processing factor SLU7